MAIRTIVALFDDYREAEGAIRELEAAGVPSTDVNLIANNAGNRYGDYPQYGIDRPARADHADTGSAAGTGAASARGWAAPPAFSPVSARWQFLG